MRFTVRRMMVITAVLAGLLALVIVPEYEGRADLHRLGVGREVVITDPHVADPSRRAVPAGTRAIVVADDWDDESSDSEQREVFVRLPDGLSLKLRREQVRPTRWGW